MALWLGVRKGPTHVVDAQAWLEGQGVPGRLEAAMQSVLMKLWQDAYKAGLKGAGEVTGGSRAIPDQIVADRITRMASRWLREVTQTRLDRIAAILAKGGTQDSLVAALKAALEDDYDARRIVVTETTRAMQEAARDAYRAAGVRKVRWITRSADPCPICLGNEAAGPRYLGEAFPSGSTAPPEHPNCECALIPAESDE